MDLAERVHHARLMLGHSIVLPTPPTVDALMQRARAEGLAAGQVFVVSRRLHPGLRGGYERNTGNIWLHYWAGESEGERLLLQCLLVILAHIKLQRPVPTTIEEDWCREGDAWREACVLASDWEMPDLLHASELSERLRELERLETWHQAAGELAGVRDPFLARSAFHALVDIREREGWSDEAFEAALFGYSEDEAANAAVLAFDRTVLRAVWSIPYRSTHDGPPFGELTLPQNRHSVGILRAALAAASEGRASQVSLATIARSWLDAPLHLHFLRGAGELDASALIALCNCWLIEAHADLAAEALWWVYGTRTTRIYRLCVRYKPAVGSPAPSAVPSARELWVLFTGDHGRGVEAAFQRYILCWLSMAGLQLEPLEQGLLLLWDWLQQAETGGGGEASREEYPSEEGRC
jgi:hypothetical protein